MLGRLDPFLRIVAHWLERSPHGRVVQRGIRFSVELRPALLVCIALQDALRKTFQTIDSLCIAYNGTALINPLTCDAEREPIYAASWWVVAAFAALCAGTVLYPFLSFRLPERFDPARESTDLAVCFHINRVNHGPKISTCRYVLVAFVLVATAVLVTLPQFVIVAGKLIEAIYFPVLVACLNVLSLFSKTNYNRMTYSQFQNRYLRDGVTFGELSLAGLYIGLTQNDSRARVLEACSREAWADVRGPSATGSTGSSSKVAV